MKTTNIHTILGGQVKTALGVVIHLEEALHVYKKEKEEFAELLPMMVCGLFRILCQDAPEKFTLGLNNYGKIVRDNLIKKSE